MYEVFPHVYFGGAGITHNPNVMLRTGITHVVNCDSSYSSTSYAAQALNFLFLKSYDDEDWPILDTHLDCLCSYVDAAIGCRPPPSIFSFTALWAGIAPPHWPSPILAVALEKPQQPS